MILSERKTENYVEIEILKGIRRLLKKIGIYEG